MNLFSLISLFFISIIILYISLDKAEALKIESILGGTPVENCQLKYKVAIVAYNIQVCGGVILNEEYVATAAHCVHKDEGIHAGLSLTVVANISNLYHEDLMFVTKVDKIYLHQDYVATMPEADIAILRVVNPFIFDKYSCMAKVKLPLDVHKKYVGEEVTVSGYGNVAGDKKVTLNGNHKSTDQLFSLKTRIIPNNECQKKWDIYTDIFPKVPQTKVKDSYICSVAVGARGDNPKGTCKGDSGAPLVTKDNTFIGIVSFGPLNCNEFYAPGIHSRVTYYLNFIKKAMKDDSNCHIVTVYPVVVCVMWLEDN